MTDLSDLLSAEAVDDALHVTSKKALFQQMAVTGARLTGHDSKAIAAAMNEREKTGTTGFGNGIAIPHGKLPGLERIVGMFARLTVPLPYQAIDQIPVDLVFLLLSPPDAGADHLKALAKVSRAMRDKSLLAKLRGARSRDALFAVLAGSEARDAA